ncbi:melibiose carrier protein, Na+/melibiose symporter [Lachnospiraceae bacterium KM106-2]|nr:melibiose carrier protein, Na+/melibiose symporter [Lachnospiraceae bacterium KM106-2]
MKLSGREKVSYGLGAVGKDMVYALVSGFLMFYYNDTLHISATFIGLVFMAARVFDAFNDPLMGVVVEKTHSKMGKYRPWLLSGTVLNAAILFAMFSVPESVTGTSLKIYIAAAYVLWGVTYTMMDIPFWSMIPAITDAGQDRENMTVIARSCAGVGNAIATMFTIEVVRVLGGGNSRIGYKWCALIAAIIFVIFELITVANVREKHVEKKETPSVKDLLKALIQNDQALVVVVAIILFNGSLYLTQQLSLYFFKYYLNQYSFYTMFAAIGGATQIIAMMFFPVLRKKFGRMKIFVGSIICALGGYATLFALASFGVKNVYVICIPSIFVFFGFGLITVLTTIFLADTVDYGEYKNNSRNESVIFSMQTFVVKLASAISALIAGVGIDVIRLDTQAKAQTASTLFGMRIIMMIIPMIGILGAMLFFRRKYKLSETYLEEISQELKERN